MADELMDKSGGVKTRKPKLSESTETTSVAGGSESEPVTTETASTTPEQPIPENRRLSRLRDAVDAGRRNKQATGATAAISGSGSRSNSPVFAEDSSDSERRTRQRRKSGRGA